MPQSDDSVQPNLSSKPLENCGQVAHFSSPGPETAPEIGKVYLVGAGPGDPRLITLRGIECLELAEVVLYDGLANPSLLDFAVRAEKVSVGKHGTWPIWSQADINQTIVDLALRGKIVVRLKGGDPAVFARTAEELEALEANRIPFEVVPGITAALAVAGYTGIPLTHRHHASAVALVTGQQQDGAPEDLDWGALALFPGTLIIYMGVTTSRQWTESLIAGGKSGKTPAAIVRRCSWNDQLVIRCTLDEVADHMTPASKLRPPVLVIVGDVAKLGTTWNWFEKLPLHGMGVWLPRSERQASELKRLLEQRGASVFTDPAVEIRQALDDSQLANAMKLLLAHELHGLTFSSANGVDHFFRYLWSVNLDARLLGGVRLASVGPATSRQLQSYGLRVDTQPANDFDANGLVEALGDGIAGEHWLVTTTNHSRNTLSQGMEQAGAKVTTCLTYETVDCTAISDALRQAISSGVIQLAIITSSHIAQVAKGLLGEATSNIAGVALGTKVATSMSQLDWPPAAISDRNTAESIMSAVIDVAEKNHPI